MYLLILLNICCLLHISGPVNAFLSWRLWAPLSRLNYALYLVDPIVTNIIILMSRTSLHYSGINLVTKCYLLSFYITSETELASNAA